MPGRFMRKSLPIISCFVLGAFGEAPAQFGVSPGQDGGFMREMHRRHQGGEAEDPLGEDRVLLEQMQAMGAPHYLNNSLFSSVRRQGDLTGFQGLFSPGHGGLSPWSGTVVRPGDVGEAGYAASLDQVFEWNRMAGTDFYLSTTSMSVAAATGDIHGNGRLALNAAGGASLTQDDDLMLSSAGGHVAWFLLPGSSLTYDVQRGPWSLTLYDRLSARPGSILSAYTFFQTALQNDLGLVLSREITSSVTAAFSYNWASSQSYGNKFRSGYGLQSYSERDLHSILLSLSWQASSRLLLGLEGGRSWNDQESEFYADGRLWHAGGFAEARLPWRHQLRLTAGVQGMSFEEPPPQFIFLAPPLVDPTPAFITNNTGDGNDLSTSPAYSLTLRGRLTERLVHELSAGYEASLAQLTNYVQSHYVNESVQADLWRGASLGLGGFYEWAESSGYSGGSYAFFANQVSRYGGMARFQQNLGDVTVAVGWGYAKSLTSSDSRYLPRGGYSADDVRGWLPYGDQEQQVVSASLSWRCHPRSTVRLAWEYLNSRLRDVPGWQASQSRVQLGVRFTF